MRAIALTLLLLLPLYSSGKKKETPPKAEIMVSYNYHETFVRGRDGVAERDYEFILLFKKLGNLRALEDEREEQDRNYRRFLKTAIVTARSAPAHKRVINTLRSWNITVDETHFLEFFIALHQAGDLVQLVGNLAGDVMAYLVDIGITLQIAARHIQRDVR